ncbi:membrane-bound lytic murein transglycosylase MltF [Algibacillus agarilyticus]|uniref:membrane-bound lytic murein transglycosylase MltF n=1 Tax=Algibacillus agarilyticus TaxID=2234133 RepID=UPI001E47EBEB|nr:membrane-bound lytic murein transglycosylase MltF [Algibacillus agarilyticus]
MILSQTQNKLSISIQVRLCLIIFTIFCFSGCNNDKPLNHAERIKKAGEIKIGTLYGQTTYYINADGPAGFEYELMAGFAEYLGVKLNVVPAYHLREIFPRLQRQEIDFIAAGITVTPERLTHFRFAPPYKNISQKLVFKQGNTRPRTLNDLNGTLVVTQDSSHAEWLTVQKEAYPDLTWQETAEQDPEELMQAVINEEIAYTIVDSHHLAVNRRVSPELSIGFTFKDEEQLAWAFNQSQDDSLYALFIEYFGMLNQTATLTTLEDKYYGHVDKFNYVDTRKFLQSVEKKLPKYEQWFMQYAEQYDLDWRLLAAISYQESHWNPRAKSPTGVRGIMMLTQPTAKQVGVTNRLDAQDNIRGGAKYIASLIKRIPDRITNPDRLWFALASYNIGLGHLEDARVLTQRDGGDPDKWVDVRERLPWLHKKRYYKTTKYGYARGNEAITYVANIRRYYDSLVWLATLEERNNVNDQAVPEVDEEKQQTAPVLDSKKAEI